MEKVARPIRRIAQSVPVKEGGGVRLRRAFGMHRENDLDPFLLLDDFRSDNPDDYRSGFPAHPHRGFETVTYMLEGSVEHRDSLGNSGVIGPGDVQWMTAGSGIVHEEMPHGDERGRIGGFQLWVNLPAELKMTAPRYRGVGSADIPVASLPGGGSARVIAGEVEGVRGPVDGLFVPVTFLDVTVTGNSSFKLHLPAAHNAFAYVVEGKGYFDDSGDPFEGNSIHHEKFDIEYSRSLGPNSVIVFGPGDLIAASAGEDGLRMLLGHGMPLGEPVAWSGSIVMNTRDEISAAFEELERGDFIKHEPAE